VTKQKHIGFMSKILFSWGMRTCLAMVKQCTTVQVTKLRD